MFLERRTFMKCISDVRVIVLLAMLAAFSGPAALAGSLSAPDLQPYLDADGVAKRIEKGDTVVVKQARFTEVFDGKVFNGGKGTLVMFLVPQSVDTAWDALHDFDGQHAYMPHMTSSKFLRNEDGRQIVRYEYDVLWTQSTTHLAGESDRETGTLVWRLAPEHSDMRLKGLNIFWRVLPYGDGRTLMAYFQNIKYSSSIGSMGSRFLVGPKNTAKAVRKQVESLNVESGSPPHPADD